MNPWKKKALMNPCFSLLRERVENTCMSIGNNLPTKRVLLMRVVSVLSLPGNVRGVLVNDQHIRGVRCVLSYSHPSRGSHRLESVSLFSLSEYLCARIGLQLLKVLASVKISNVP